MKTQTLLIEARNWYQDWMKRKNWETETIGPHTSPEEDQAAQIILCLTHKLRGKK